MSSNFRLALELIRQKSNNTTELGATFEKLVKVFLQNDSTQTQQYEKVWHYSNWAAEQEGYSKKDIGIDLVAKIRGQDTFCAIQCKCYQSENQITKEDLLHFTHQLHCKLRGAKGIKLTGLPALNEIENILFFRFIEERAEIKDIPNEIKFTAIC